MKKLLLCLSASLVAVALLVSPLYAEGEDDTLVTPCNNCTPQKGTDPGW